MGASYAVHESCILLYACRSSQLPLELLREAEPFALERSWAERKLVPMMRQLKRLQPFHSARRARALPLPVQLRYNNN